MASTGSYIVAGARTPIGKMSGALSSFSAADLGGFAIAAALERAGVAPDEVDHVIMGQVLMAGQGQVPSRQAAVNSPGRGVRSGAARASSVTALPGGGGNDDSSAGVGIVGGASPTGGCTSDTALNPTWCGPSMRCATR